MLKEQENNDRCGLRISTSEHKKKVKLECTVTSLVPVRIKL